MKKIIFALLFISSSAVFADKLVNLQQEKIMCSNYQLKASSTIEEITKYCKPYDVDHDHHNGKVETELEFYASAPHNYEMKCNFIESKLDYCKIDD
ncbi:MAG: hypothetical protein EKK54_02870 [Neisseriaceae bacterium]|nr:MAG: hypothetical protein EKK54_02870 [Neisseriaceae bacterium]